MLARHSSEAPVRLRVRPRREAVQTVLVRVAVVVLAIAVLLLLVVSPLGLLAGSRLSDDDWSRISNLGQAYGAVSAVISGIATIGVAYSLVVQARQYKLEQNQCAHTNQLELMKLLLDDPTLLAGPETIDGVSPDRTRQQLYVNLAFKHLQMSYLTGYITEAALPLHFADPFCASVVRDWWRQSRETYWLEANTKQKRRFVQIVDAACADAEHKWSSITDWWERDEQVDQVYRGWDRLESRKHQIRTPVSGAPEVNRRRVLVVASIAAASAIAYRFGRSGWIGRNAATPVRGRRWRWLDAASAANRPAARHKLLAAKRVHE